MKKVVACAFLLILGLALRSWWRSPEPPPLDSGAATNASEATAPTRTTDAAPASADVGEVVARTDATAMRHAVEPHPAAAAGAELSVLVIHTPSPTPPAIDSHGYPLVDPRLRLVYRVHAHDVVRAHEQMRARWPMVMDGARRCIEAARFGDRELQEALDASIVQSAAQISGLQVEEVLWRKRVVFDAQTSDPGNRELLGSGEFTTVTCPDPLKHEFTPLGAPAGTKASLGLRLVYVVRSDMEKAAHEHLQMHWATAQAELATLFEQQRLQDLQAESGLRVLEKAVQQHLDNTLFPSVGGMRPGRVSKVAWTRWLIQ